MHSGVLQDSMEMLRSMDAVSPDDIWLVNYGLWYKDEKTYPDVLRNFTGVVMSCHVCVSWNKL
jgi:hypothetical protein